MTHLLRSLKQTPLSKEGGVHGHTWGGFLREAINMEEPMPLLLITKYGVCRSSVSKGRMSGLFRRMSMKDRSHGLTPAGNQSHTAGHSPPAQWEGNRIKQVKNNLVG